VADTDNNSMVVADGGTGLMASDGDSGMADEQKSGFASAMGNVDLLRQLTLVMALAICLAIAVFVIMWANQPEYRFLTKQPTEQLIKTMDFLDANGYNGVYRQANNTISVPIFQYLLINIKILKWF